MHWRPISGPSSEGVAMRSQSQATVRQFRTEPHNGQSGSVCILVIAFACFYLGKSRLSLVEGDDRIRQADQHKRTWVADASVHTVFQLAPVRGRLAEFVSHERVSKRFPKWKRISHPGHFLGDSLPLPRRGIVIPRPQIIEALYLSLIQEARDQIAHIPLECAASGYDDANRNCAISMQPFEIF